MKILNICFLFFTILIAGCNTQPSYEFWNISRFNLSEDALGEGEEIKLIYTSQAPEKSKEECYIHLIVYSQETGDTVNILTTTNNGFKPEDRDEVYNFFPANSLVAKVMQASSDDVKISNIEQLENLEVKKINKVARDPDFDYIADNNYPTMIGFVGKFMSGKK